MSRSGIDRRGFLSLASAFLAVLLPSGACAGTAEEGSGAGVSASKQDALRAYFGRDDLRAVARLGRTILARLPEVARQAASEAEAALAESPDAEAVVRAWRERVERDFAERTITPVAGWRLSRTELGLCALVAER